MAARSARTSNGAPAFADPLNTDPPAATVTGNGSPLSVLVSTTASALTTVPSTGITSPVRTSTTSPTSTRSTATCSRPPSTRSHATFGARWTSAVNSRRARRDAAASSASPPENISPITTPASSSPSANAPTIATSAIVSTPRW